MTIDPRQYELYARCIRTGQVDQSDVPALLAENPDFAEWYAGQIGRAVEAVPPLAASAPRRARLQRIRAACRPGTRARRAIAAGLVAIGLITALLVLAHESGPRPAMPGTLTRAL
jgi:hypothetical protein